jgi:hypothetical protein
MFTLRCTRKLLRKIPAAILGENVAPTTLLGDWYANVLFLRPHQIVLCISERTLLPLIVPANDAVHLVDRLVKELPEILTALKIQPSAIVQEIGAMQVRCIGSTNDRRVVGSLNELVFQLQHQLRFRPGLALVEHALRLAETPMSLINSSPDRATQSLFDADLTRHPPAAMSNRKLPRR